ncbi:hypothetical protein CGT95_09435 [Vibrio metoecus]|nr:hypothetical protein XV94_16805 [Vibrio metoecus]PAR21901.1 hypothetical protein CGU02_16925 [Vibrio metoecus]PAR46732.1 hypothetical protein CGT95_09435 [Vibrio metoecus]
MECKKHRILAKFTLFSCEPMGIEPIGFIFMLIIIWLAILYGWRENCLLIMNRQEECSDV